MHNIVHPIVGIPPDEAHGRSAVGEESALVGAARQNPAAFGALYQRYLDRVYAYLRARTDREEDAADLTQQVFLQALDALPRYRGQGDAFAGWLFRIARNTATNFHARRRRAVALDLVPAALQPVAAHDLEREALRHEDAARLHILLATLGEDKRELLALRFAAGLTIAEIATVLGKREAATRKMLTRTLHTLQEHYHDYDETR